MFDWFTTYSHVGLDTIKEVESKVALLSEVRLVNGYGLTYHNGYLMNEDTGRKMGVTWNKEKETLTLKVCPNKFLLGNNVQEASIEQVSNMFYNLSEMFSYDFAEAIVRRCDVTHTAEVERHPCAYYPFFCNQDTFSRLEHKTSLYYKKQGFTKVCYDKAKEVDQRKTWGGRQKMPPELKDKNLFRFEVRYNSSQQVSRAVMDSTSAPAHLTVSEVLSEFVVERLQKQWIKEYDNIPKMTELPFNFTKLNGAKAIKDEIKNLALSKLGRLNIEKLIFLASDSGALSTSKQLHDARDILTVFEERASKSSHILELDEKIHACKPKMEGYD